MWLAVFTDWAQSDYPAKTQKMSRDMAANVY